MAISPAERDNEADHDEPSQTALKLSKRHTPESSLAFTGVNEAYHPPRVEDGSATDPIFAIQGTNGHSFPKMRASFQFDAAEGFGDWQLWLLSRAHKDLRFARKKNPKLFDIIINKMKDLSHGHFSDDNQKRLVGSNSEIPVFEAKMTGDTRLVYMVDCVKDFETELEKQVLRIFGVYTHAQFDGRLWSVVSKFLSGKGAEYRRRCIFRKAPLHAGDHFIPPESFAPLDASNLAASTSLSIQDLQLENEDREALHELLVLDKFVAFTKVVMESILADEDAAHVFDMSPVEQEIVKCNDSCIVMGRSGTGKTTSIVFKIFGIEQAWLTAQDHLAEGLERPRQLFVTQSQMLATNMKEYYQKLCIPYSAKLRHHASLEDAHPEMAPHLLVDREEENVLRDTLPDRWSELKDEHFPLFLSFDHLCLLLGADVLDADTAYFEVAHHRANGTESLSWSTLQRQNISKFVSYDRFLNSYWPHFPQHITKDLDSLLIFSEFMGVIKGSEGALESENGSLSQAQYAECNLRQGVLTNQREAVYTLFQTYQKMKRERREWDAADRTHSLLRALKRNSVPGKKLDFIYVDETQDNLLIDALVLNMLAKSAKGLFWAGDTAQTISAGSSFRFEELKAFLHRSSPARPLPRCFQLSLNYRSHGGILRCANSLVKLITSFWPHAIDRLDDEKGMVDGSKPVFFSGKVKSEDYLLGVSAERMEFGAKQCILVRDEKTREELQALVGDIGLVLTLQESKGLEFDDVLLYKFLEDSLVPASQWRVLLNALPAGRREGVKCPTFDGSRHAGLCHELKCMYVGLTRARKSVWIVDSSAHAQPLRTLWKTQDFVEDCSSLDVLPRFARTSVPEEWSDTALRLFEHGHYSQAMRCYERAGMHRERDVARAYDLRRQAQASDLSTANDGFLIAGEAFVDCAAASSDPSEVQVYRRIATQCFLQFGDLERAAEYCLLVGDYEQCARCYRRLGNIDKVVDLIKAHRADIESSVVDNILKVAKLYYVKNQPEALLPLFDSVEEALRFAKHRSTTVMLAAWHEAIGQRADAANLLFQEGRVKAAMSLLRKDAGNPTSAQQAERCILSALWDQLPFGTRVRGSPPQPLRVLLTMANAMRKDLSLRALDHVAMFEAVSNQRPDAEAKALGLRLWDIHKDKGAAARCLDFYFVKFFGRRPAHVALTAEELHSTLIACTILIKQLAAFGNNAENLDTDADMQQVFRLKRNPDGSVETWKFAFLYHFVEMRPGAYRFRKSEDGTTLRFEFAEFKRIFRDALRLRMSRLLNDEEAYYRRSALNCLGTVIPLEGPDTTATSKGTCGPSAASAILHIDMFMSQIVMYDAVLKFDKKLVTFPAQLCCLDRLYGLLYPNKGAYREGAPANSAEYDIGSRILLGWMRQIIQRVSCWSTFKKLGPYLVFVAKFGSLAFRFDPQTARRCIEVSPCLTFDPGNSSGAESRRIRRAVQGLLCMLEGTTSASLPSGLAFLEIVGVHRLYFDAGVLCDIIETLAVRFVTSYRLHDRKTLNNIVLRQSWIAKIGPASHRRVEDLRLLPVFVEAIGLFIEGLWLRDKSFLSDSDGGDLDDDECTSFTLRIFRSLILVAYNLPNQELRARVLELVTSLRSRTESEPMLSEFTIVETFTELVEALWLSQAPAGFIDADEVIVLKDSEHFEMHREACVVVFDEADEGTSDLLYDSETQDTLVRMSRETTPLWDWREPPGSEGVVGALSPSTQLFGMPRPPDDENSDLEYDLALASRLLGAYELPVYKPAIPTDREHAAATTIARFWRRQLDMRPNVPRGVGAIRARWFALCRTQASPMGLKLKYRVLFLGPLSHALVCLEGIVCHARAVVNRLRDSLVTTELADYEVLADDMDKAISLLTKAEKLKSDLDPSSEFHRKQDVEALREMVATMETLARELPAHVRKQWRRDLEFAVKGIVRLPTGRRGK